jgi:hypothetical protein
MPAAGRSLNRGANPSVSIVAQENALLATSGMLGRGSLWAAIERMTTIFFEYSKLLIAVDAVPCIMAIETAGSKRRVAAA